MSHYSVYETQIVSTEHLLRALKDMGFEQVEVHESPQVLYGYLGDAREQRAEVIVRKKYVGEASNDIGFARNAEGRFEAIISDFDRWQYFGPVWLKRLMQRYAYHVAKDTLERQNFTVVSEELRRDQTIHLTVRRMA